MSCPCTTFHKEELGKWIRWHLWEPEILSIALDKDKFEVHRASMGFTWSGPHRIVFLGINAGAYIGPIEIFTDKEKMERYILLYPYILEDITITISEYFIASIHETQEIVKVMEKLYDLAKKLGKDLTNEYIFSRTINQYHMYERYYVLD